MKYLVIEIQKFADGTIGVPPISSYDSYFDAVSRFHTVMATAAISDVPVHSAVMLTDTGSMVRMDSYNKSEGEPNNE